MAVSCSGVSGKRGNAAPLRFDREAHR